MPYYVKVTKKVREAILPAYLVLRRTFDGNYLIYQSALERVEGNTLRERCDNVGGALLTPLEAKEEIAGTSCRPCYTPKAYGGDDIKTGEPDVHPDMTGDGNTASGSDGAAGGSENTEDTGSNAEGSGDNAETPGDNAEGSGDNAADSGDNAAEGTETTEGSDTAADTTSGNEQTEAPAPASAAKSNTNKKVKKGHSNESE